MKINLARFSEMLFNSIVMTNQHIQYKVERLENSEAIAKLSSGAGFASFTYRSKGRNELARWVVNIGQKYENILVKSIEGLEAAIQLGEFAGVELEAAEEQLASWKLSLDKHSVNESHPDYTQKDTWEYIAQGISRHNDNGSLRIAALLQSYVVLEKGQDKEEPKSEMAKAKAKIRKMYPIGKWVTAKFENLKFVRRNGETLEFSETETELVVG